MASKCMLPSLQDPTHIATVDIGLPLNHLVRNIQNLSDPCYIVLLPLTVLVRCFYKGEKDNLHIMAGSPLVEPQNILGKYLYIGDSNKKVSV